MKLVLAVMILLMFGAVAVYLDFQRDLDRDREIAALKARVDGLQLVASGKIEPPVFDGVRVIRPKVVKQMDIRY